MTEFFTYVKEHPLSSYLQDYLDQMCEKENKCQWCHKVHSITALKGLLIGRIVRTKNFNWLFVLQKQFIGRDRYRPIKSIVLVNEDCIDPDNTISLTRLRSTLTCFYIDNEMHYPTWEVYGMLENIEIGDKRVTIRCRRISEKTIDSLIDKIVVQEKEIE